MFITNYGKNISIIAAVVLTLLTSFTTAFATNYFHKQQNQRCYFEREQLATWGLIGDHFTNYRFHRQRLNDMELYRLSHDEHELPSNFLDDKSYNVKMRNENLQALQSLFSKAKYYFSDDVTQLMDEFTSWRQQYRMSYIHEQPADSEYYAFQDKIMHAMKKELPDA